ncbi:response regulator transcription factor [Nocardia sp. NPDC050712]|uniref:response regulator transcription factor n=1 Tax=Nocardia sp. NPDC050712 TaxID=3155518 RepID=UPI00340791FB
MRVLIADDDPVVREVVRRYLERDGLTVVEAADGPTAAKALAKHDLDLAVLDVMMPPPDGIELCRTVRAVDQDVAIILLTALGEEEDRVIGLSAGADDYLTKPFSPRELALRVAAVLRRIRQPAAGAQPVLRSGAIEVHPGARTARVDGVPVELTAREFDLLAFLLANQQRVFSRSELLAQVWGWNFGDQSTVTVHIKRLRAKLGAAHGIDTVWGHGYAWGRVTAKGAGA